MDESALTPLQQFILRRVTAGGELYSTRLHGEVLVALDNVATDVNDVRVLLQAGYLEGKRNEFGDTVYTLQK